MGKSTVVSTPFSVCGYACRGPGHSSPCLRLITTVLSESSEELPGTPVPAGEGLLALSGICWDLQASLHLAMSTYEHVWTHYLNTHTRGRQALTQSQLLCLRSHRHQARLVLKSGFCFLCPSRREQS